MDLDDEELEATREMNGLGGLITENKLESEAIENEQSRKDKIT